MVRKHPKRRRNLRRRPRTEWHPPFGALLEERSPRWVEVTLEVTLQRQSQRVDVVLLRRVHVASGVDDPGRVLRSLWRHLRHVALLEFKSVARLFAPGDLYRLVALGWHWLARNPEHAPDEVLLVLVVPALTGTLLDELALCPATLAEVEPGYHHVAVRGMRLVVVELDVVAESERDDYLRVFSHHPIQTEEVVHWLREHTDLPEDAVLSPEEVAKNEPYLIKLAKSLPLSIRLKDLEPEERVAGLSEADRVLALPDAALRGLSADYLATLPEAAQQRIRERLGR